MKNSTDRRLETIKEKVDQGIRLDREDGLALFECDDLLTLGELAHKVRTRLHEDRTYYVLNRHINYSNICINGCAFCAFGKPKNDPMAFELTADDIAKKLAEPSASSIKEIHIVGGCHPDLPLSYYEELVKTARNIHPDCTIKAYTAVEIAHMAKVENISVEEVLKRLKAVGLDMLPGGGAEIFAEHVRSKLCPKKLDSKGWLNVTKCAHNMGIKTNATMLFGHLESYEDRVDHLLSLRNLQDETGGFVCFIPLPFQSKKSPMNHIPGPTGIDILKTIAVSRLILDNIPHIKAYWIMLTVKLAQVALHFGADDFDGTVIEEKIGHMAGAESEEALTREELSYIIQTAGFKPIERNGFFEPISN